MTHSPQLLVSVRSASEAAAARGGGAHVIDVKEPLHGSLGRASDAVITEVLDCVAGRRPVSAAMGELVNPEGAQLYLRPGLAFAKWGLSALGQVQDWPRRLEEMGRRVREVTPSCRPVTVAYVDCQLAGAPSVEAVLTFALRQPGGILLLDTFQKASSRDSGMAPTLLDLLPLRQLAEMCAECRDAGVRVALAGSLRADHFRDLRAARPDWFAVRGAACDDNRRDAAVSASRVRALLELLT
jgi:uncharacterized protein (UPF0264 family)